MAETMTAEEREKAVDKAKTIETFSSLTSVFKGNTTIKRQDTWGDYAMLARYALWSQARIAELEGQVAKGKVAMNTLATMTYADGELIDALRGPYRQQVADLQARVSDNAKTVAACLERLNDRVTKVEERLAQEIGEWNKMDGRVHALGG